MALQLQNLFCKKLLKYSSTPLLNSVNVINSNTDADFNSENNNNNNSNNNSNNSTIADSIVLGTHQYSLFSKEELNFVKIPNPKRFQKSGEYSYHPRRSPLHNNGGGNERGIFYFFLIFDF
jgi:hypothetical protein